MLGSVAGAAGAQGYSADKPLGMTASSYVFSARYEQLKAYRHDDFGKVSGRTEKIAGGLAAIKGETNAAASLNTNAADYAKFIIAVLNGTGLKQST